MGWTRRANPKWKRKAMRQRYPSEVMCMLNYDRHGTVKREAWAFDWTGSRNQSRRYVNRLHRHAGKLQIKFALYEDLHGDIEEYYDELDWYDDEPMELPDWWYSGDPYDPDFIEPEDNDQYDYDYMSDIYDDWFDDYDSYYDCPRYYRPPIDNFEHHEHPSYQNEVDRYMNAPVGKSLADILQEIKDAR